MSFSNGVFSINSAGQPVVSGQVISSTAFNLLTADLASGLSTAILKDGTQTLTANIPMGGFKLTGLAAGTAAGNSLRYEQGLQSIMTTLGDTVYASAANTAARLAAAATVAAHATTMDPWVARVVTLSGSVVTFTDMADAPYVGASVLLIMNDAHIFTEGAVFDIQGGATYTTAAGDQVLLVATTVSTFDVTIFPANGGVVGIKGRVPLTLGTEATTTGNTTIPFTGIPAGVKRITINCAGVTTNGTSSLQVQIGDTDGIENTGYKSRCTNITASTAATAGFIINHAISGAGDTQHGRIVLELEDAATFTWVCTSIITIEDGTDAMQIGSGSKALTAELTQLVITAANGTDTFSAVPVNITYE